VGAVWNVGWGWQSGNDYGEDTLGFITPSIDWYRRNLPASAMPCSVVIPQAMTIVNSMPGYPNQQYATHTIAWTIGSTTVTVGKDNYTVQRTYVTPQLPAAMQLTQAQR
jgi:hypothetical protein